MFVQTWIVLGAALTGGFHVFAYRRDHSNIANQIHRMVDILNETAILINTDAEPTPHETLRIQIAANEFCLYMQEATNLMHKSVELIHDASIIKRVNVFIDLGRKSTYNIEKYINGDIRKLKRALKFTLEQYIIVVEDAVGFFTQGDFSNDVVLHLISTAREAFDMALFNFLFIHTQIKYYNESRQEIGSLIVKLSNETYTILDNIRSSVQPISEVVPTPENGNSIIKESNQTSSLDSKKISSELSVYTHHITRLLDILVRKLERWTYTYTDEPEKSKMINDVVANLNGNVRDLRKSLGWDATTEKLTQSLKEFIQRCFAVKTLSVIDGGEHQPDVFQSILLELVAISRTFKAKLDLLPKSP